MSDKLIDNICSTLSSIGLPLCTVELASWAVANGIDSAAMENLYSLLKFADDKRASDKAEDLRRKSRLPDDCTKTFDSFNVDRLLEKDQKHLSALMRSLAFIPARKGVLIQGTGRTGKSHILQAIGNESCNRGYRTLYLTASDLKRRISKALEKGSEERLVNTLTNYSCLIIDALDKEYFDSRQSYVFHRLVDAQLTRLKPGSMIIATSKDLPLLADHFEERDYFIATMDRILEHFTCFVLQGKAFNGKPKDVVMLKLI